MTSYSIIEALKSSLLRTRALSRSVANLVDLSLSGGGALPAQQLELLARSLLSGKGEASGVAIARSMLDLYARLDRPARLDFFQRLATGFGPDPAAIDAAWSRYKADGEKALTALAQSIEAPRQNLFRRLNLAPGGTAALVGMRADLLELLPEHPSLETVDNDLSHLLQSWFNRGFLTMERLSWSSPADVLERVIRYEAVHSIQGWADLRSRLDPPDRQCFAFFHPAMPGEPLIFVEVALTREIPHSIQALLAVDRDMIQPGEANTAVFYSISNCQPGLRGISFGHFLIKQVAQDLALHFPNIVRFVTLSPVPGFLAYLKKAKAGEDTPAPLDKAIIKRIGTADWLASPEEAEQLRPALTAHALHYFLKARTGSGKPIDPVARFHLGNGARLERLNWLGDISENGLRQSAGLMVNYLYDLKTIEQNHEAFANRDMVVTGKPIRQLVKSTKP